MRIRSTSQPLTSTRNGGSKRNGQPCPRCSRFGTYAPNSIVCDHCQGALPLVFIVMITVLVGGAQ